MIILITGASHTGKTLLAQRMLENIDSHFDQIKEHASDIEARPDDSCCTAEHMKRENRQVIKGYRAVGEQVAIITEDYEETIRRLVK